MPNVHARKAVSVPVEKIKVQRLKLGLGLHDQTEALQQANTSLVEYLQLDTGADSLHDADTVSMLLDNDWIRLDKPLLSLEVDRMPHSRGERIVPGVANLCTGYGVLYGDETTDMKAYLWYEERMVCSEGHGNEKKDRMERDRENCLVLTALISRECGSGSCTAVTRRIKGANFFWLFGHRRCIYMCRLMVCGCWLRRKLQVDRRDFMSEPDSVQLFELKKVPGNTFLKGVLEGLTKHSRVLQTHLSKVQPTTGRVQLFH